MKIATFNAASVRARLPVLQAWMAEIEPDVLAIQETKVEDDKFPRAEFEELGYHIALHGQKAWNGVAILSKVPIGPVQTGFADELFPTDCRIIACEISGIHIVNTYVPNGNTVGSDKFVYKLAWLDRFRTYLDQNYRPHEPLIWLGDINIAPRPQDVYDSKRMLGSVGHHPDEFSRLDKIVDFGLTDLFRKFEPGAGHYTFWDFQIPRSVERNLGWRIDHIYATDPVSKLCRSCTVDMDPRKWLRPSDHTFVVAEFDI